MLRALEEDGEAAREVIFKGKNDLFRKPLIMHLMNTLPPGEMQNIKTAKKLLDEVNPSKDDFKQKLDIFFAFVQEKFGIPVISFLRLSPSPRIPYNLCLQYMSETDAADLAREFDYWLMAIREAHIDKVTKLVPKNILYSIILNLLFNNRRQDLADAFVSLKNTNEILFNGLKSSILSNSCAQDPLKALIERIDNGEDINLAPPLIPGRVIPLEPVEPQPETQDTHPAPFVQEPRPERGVQTDDDEEKKALKNLAARLREELNAQTSDVNRKSVHIANVQRALKARNQKLEELRKETARQREEIRALQALQDTECQRGSASSTRRASGRRAGQGYSGTSSNRRGRQVG